MKRPNKTGSCYKLPGKRRRPYAARICTGIGVNSKGNIAPLYKYVGFFEKRSDALAALEKYNVTEAAPGPGNGQGDAGGQFPAEGHARGQNAPRFKELFEIWYQEKEGKVKQLSLSALKSYRQGFKHLRPIHEMAMPKIRLSDLEGCFRSCVGMSPSTIGNMKKVLHGVYKYAMRHDIIEKDYSALLEAESTNENARPHSAFTKEEIALLWQNKDDTAAQIVLCLIYTGMRIMELLEVKSRDVNLKERYLVGGKKTAAGKNRKIPIHKAIMPFLNVGHEYLFVESSGKPYNYGKFTSKMQALMARLGMNHKAHDTRHTCATLLEEAGVELYHRKLILGHSSGDLTESVYTHVPVETLVKDMDMVRVEFE